MYSLIQFPTLFSITEDKRVKSLPAAYKDMCEPISLPNRKTTIKQTHQSCECERKKKICHDFNLPLNFMFELEQFYVFLLILISFFCGCPLSLHLFTGSSTYNC